MRYALNWWVGFPSLPEALFPGPAKVFPPLSYKKIGQMLFILFLQKGMLPSLINKKRK
jgi:hypothetical protein